MDYLLTVEGATGTVSTASVIALIASKLTASRGVAGYFYGKKNKLSRYNEVLII